MPIPGRCGPQGGPGHAIFFDGQGVGFAGMGMGSIILTVTNLDTGESARVNISGPGGLE